MDPSRWQRIEELYHAARERGPAALEGTDPDLRREVEELLTQDTAGIGESMALPQNDDAPAGWSGQTISRYRVLELLGRGGMGEVYKAVDTRLDRMVALKFLPAHLSADPALKRRLKREARTASALDHPNIVVVHDIGEAPGGETFIAMAFHEGVTLREKIREGIPTHEALRIARQIAAGLEKAHENHIFHRDIKPGNVIVAKDGVARIIDFGLAKSSEASASLDGLAKGTPLYMSPEQAAGGTVDCRTDLWSLGAVLYETLAGRPAFAGDSQVRVMHAIVRGSPPRLRDARPDLSGADDRIVARALEKDVAKRHQSAAEMARDLDAALVAAATPPGLRQLWRRLLRRPVTAE
jgi:serine/threonine-protein kinase